MRRTVITATLLVGALGYTAAAAGHGKPKPHAQPHPHKIKTTVLTTDGGCAGNTWANDTITRVVKVHLNADGSYRIREEDEGTFTTNAGGAVASPGNCAENKSHHGHTVSAGVVGTLKGYITGTVTGGTFDPNATCSANPCTQAMFIAAFFGPAATFSCQTSSTDCKFKYDYHAKKRLHLLFRHWQDRGTGAGSFLHEKFKGDIADA
ncbi:MAG: hypothetical protein WBB74_04490 [Gaiellaceae bacterium]